MTIWCVGRNYPEHAKELGNEIPREPLFFMKSGNCVTRHSLIPYPSSVKSLHHEIEIAYVFDSALQPSHVGLALDLTDRLRQQEAKKAGTPWTLAKSFIGSCPLSPMIPCPETREFYFELFVNGNLRQQGHSQEMIFNLDQQIRYLKENFPLTPGDLLLTGTPSGVGTLQRGDQLQGLLKNPKNQILIEWNSKIE